MKLVTFHANGEDRIGTLTKDGNVVDLRAAAERYLRGHHSGTEADTRATEMFPSYMSTFLAAGNRGQEQVSEVLEFVTSQNLEEDPKITRAKEAVELRAPVPYPPMVFMMGFNGNIIPTLKEKGWTVPDEYSNEPWWFLVPNQAVIGPHDQVVRPVGCEELGNSPELGVVIGSAAWRVSEAEAMKHVAGYTLVNDVTLWDIQKRDHFMYTTSAVKSFPTSKPIGHCITTLDEIPDPNDVKGRFMVNGESAGEESTARYRFSVAEIVSHASQYVRLEPGTVIACGALPGILEMVVEPGDVVVNELVDVAQLTNEIVQEKDEPIATFAR